MKCKWFKLKIFALTSFVAAISVATACIAAVTTQSDSASSVPTRLFEVLASAVAISGLSGALILHVLNRLNGKASIDDLGHKVDQSKFDSEIKRIDGQFESIGHRLTDGANEFKSFEQKMDDHRDVLTRIETRCKLVHQAILKEE